MKLIPKIVFHTKSLLSDTYFILSTSQFRPLSFQMFDNHMWLEFQYCQGFKDFKKFSWPEDPEIY